MARGFLAEIQRQVKIAAREQARAEKAEKCEYKSAVRVAKKARREDERLRKQLAKADTAEKKRLAKAAREAHVAAMVAEVEQKNLELAGIYNDVDTLLAAGLDVDGYIDLDSLRTVAQHPPFDRTELENPLPPPLPIADPPEPVHVEIPSPTWLQRRFGMKKHKQAVTEAAQDYQRKIDAWKEELAALTSRRSAMAGEHGKAESNRLVTLDAERKRYASECSAREKYAADHNAAIDTLIANLGYGVADAVQEYVSIVLSNSVYPESFLVDYSFSFEPSTAELELKVLVPDPSALPTIKAYKYTKSSDEISETALSQKACKDRYAKAIHQIALRSLHEIFEADRREIIKTISLQVGTETISPATGREIYVPFVSSGAERDSFIEFDLSSVVPSATLLHLGAALSKNPFELVAADITGVRRS